MGRKRQKNRKKQEGCGTGQEEPTRAKKRKRPGGRTKQKELERAAKAALQAETQEEHGQDGGRRKAEPSTDAEITRATKGRLQRRPRARAAQQPSHTGRDHKGKHHHKQVEKNQQAQSSREQGPQNGGIRDAPRKSPQRQQKAGCEGHQGRNTNKKNQGKCKDGGKKRKQHPKAQQQASKRSTQAELNMRNTRHNSTEAEDSGNTAGNMGPGRKQKDARSTTTEHKGKEAKHHAGRTSTQKKV